MISVRRWSGFHDLIQAPCQNVGGQSICGFLADGLGAQGDPRRLPLLEQNAMRSLATQRTAVANAILSRVLQTRAMSGYPHEAVQAILNDWSSKIRDDGACVT
jgi:hypothetical protein